MTQSNVGAGRLLAGRVSGVAGSLALSQLVTGLTYVVAARSIAPSSLGIIATCVAIGTIAATVFDLGLNNFVVREVASSKLDVTAARGVGRAKRRLSVALLTVTLLACLLIASTPLMSAVLGLVGVAMWEAQTANGLLRAQERFANAAAGQLGGRGVGLAVVLACVLAGLTDLALPIGLVVGFAAEAVIDRVFLGADRARPLGQRELMRMHREAVPFGLASLAASAQQLDTPLVAAGGGAMVAGIYAAAGRLLGPLGFLSSSLGLVGAPWLARAQHDPDALRREEMRIIRVAAALCLAPIVAAAVGPFLIPLILGSDYAGSGSAFVVLAIGSVFSTFNQPLAIITQNRGHQGSVATAIAIGLTIGLVATFVLALFGGAVWAAVGFMISQLYILAHLTRKILRIRKGSHAHS